MALIQQGAGDILRDFGLYWHDSITQIHCTSKMQISHHILWLGRPFEYSEVIVMFQKQFEMIWDLWNGVLTCLKSHFKMVHCGHKGMELVNGGSLWHLNDAQLVLKSPNCGEEISPTPLHHQQPEPLIQERMDPCQILTLQSQCHSRNWLIRYGNLFPILYYHILVSPCEL